MEVKTKRVAKAKAGGKKTSATTGDEAGAGGFSSAESLFAAGGFGGFFGGSKPGGQSKQQSAAKKKQIDKSDAVVTEAAQLIQDFDDREGIFKLTEKKVEDLLTKVLGRLEPDTITACVSSEGGADDSEKGIKVVSSLRNLKAQLTAAQPLVQSLTSSEGERFHHSFLKSALEQARQAKVKVSNSMDELLAIRTLTCLADALDWDPFVGLLVSGMDHLETERVTQIRCAAIVHAVEGVLRPPLVAAHADQSQAAEAVTAVGMARCRRLLELFGKLETGCEFLKTVPGMQLLKQDLQHLRYVCSCLTDSNRFDQKDDVDRAEAARTQLTSKSSKLLRAMQAFPCGAWLLDTIQERLSDYHSFISMTDGVERATLNLIDLL